MVAKRPEFAQVPVYVYLMISAALGQEEPASRSAGRVAVGVVPDHGRPGVHQLDGLARVPFVAGDVPGEGLGVGGDRVLAFVGAAVIGIGVGTALDDSPGLGPAVQVGVLARHHPVEGALPGLGTGVDLGAGEVQLPLGDGDSRVDEAAGSGVGGPGEDTGDQGRRGR
ncbi:hypothetical protein GCM10011428_85320 [Streptomyces violaceus]